MRQKFTVLLAIVLVFSALIVPVGKVSALTNLVQDPSLEAAIASTIIWKQSSTNSDTPLCTLSIPECNFGANSGPRTGSVWALFGGIDWTDEESLSPEIGDLYQNVTFPNSCSATLQFYFWIGQAPGGSDASDVFIAKVDGGNVFTANATQQSTYPSYTLVSVDVSAFADGAAHKVEFYSSTTGQQVVFNLDDVSLEDTCFTISGNAGVAGATLTYTGGSTSSDGSGNYSFDVPSGWSGTVTPSKSGYLFSPSSKTYSNVMADQTGQNYTATPALVVTNTNDSGPGSLRQTIASSSPGNAVTFDPSLAGGTITLSSEIVIDKNLIIDGSALTSKINISGNNSVRVFVVNSGVTVVMNGLSIKNGRSTGNGGAISNNGGTLTVTNSILSDSNATGDGGAIYTSSPGSLTLSDSTFSNNSAARGGGILCTGSGTLTVTNSTYVSNDAPSGSGDGGAIYTTCTSTITNSTFSANTAADSGGGVANLGTMTVTNSTFSDNNAPNGGALRNDTGGVLSLRNSILANSIGGVDCSKNNSTPAVQNINNLIETTGAASESCGTPLLSSDPMLGPLASNGGPTQTMALLPSSSAIDVGTDAGCPATDQRGVTRPQGSHCDIGAYEKQSTFGDVPFDYWAGTFIERLYAAGITSGCSLSPLQFCPEATVTRAQMAVFLLRGIHGAGYVPPAVGAGTGFGDVPTDYWAAAFIKQLAAEGITLGCGGGNYCPEAPVTRAQMAVFLLRSKHGAGYVPPAVGAGTGFGDVPPDYWAATFIKQLVTEGITVGCGNGNYCPEAPVSRAEMAVFLVRTFNLP